MRNRFKINPILKREATVTTRSMKFVWGVMGIGIIIALVFVIGIIAASESSYSYAYQSIAGIFPVAAVIETAILCLIIPAMTAGSISGERERQTLDIMLTTPMKPVSIVRGKLFSAVLKVFMFVIATSPFMAVCFSLGGMNWMVLVEYVLMILYLAVYMGSIGVFSSAVKKNSVGATICSICIIAAITIVTFVIFYIGFCTYEETYGTKHPVDIFSQTSMALIFNPFVPFVDFLLRACTGTGIYDILSDGWWNVSLNKMNGFLGMVYRWIIPISIIVNLGVSYLFIRIAALKMVVTKRKRKRKSKA